MYMKMKLNHLFVFMLLFSSFEYCYAEIIRPGEKIESTYIGKDIKNGTLFRYSVYQPKNANSEEETGLIICFDGENPNEITEKLTSIGAMPPCVVIGIHPGSLEPTREGGISRNMRAEEYDHVGREFPEFLVKEFIPAVKDKYNLKFSSSPDMHMLSGGSSGGLVTWNILWYANDFFRRGLMPSPTFGTMGGGEELLAIARKAETRPIRVASTCGTHEPNQYGGNSMLLAFSAYSALQYAGYDCLFEFRPNDGHVPGLGDWTVMKKLYSYLWANWRTEPVRSWRHPVRVETVVDSASVWQQVEERMPKEEGAEIAEGIYSYNDKTIFFTPRNGKRKIVAEGFGCISGITVSSDKWRLYVSDVTRRQVYAMTIKKDGLLYGRYILGQLHTLPDNKIFGAMDICIDETDRTYCATEIGIQSINSFGVNDLILCLPGDLPVEEIAFGGDGMNWLYARSGEKVFKRKCKIKGLKANAPVRAPLPIGY